MTDIQHLDKAADDNALLPGLVKGGAIAGTLYVESGKPPMLALVFV